MSNSRSAAAIKGAQTRRFNRFMEAANHDSLVAANAKSTIQNAPVSDGWMNILTGLGILGYDKKESTRFYSGFRLYEAELRDLLTYNGLAKRIINLPVEDMTRKWFKVEGDTDNKIVKWLRKIKGVTPNSTAKTEIIRALRYARGYGGALMVMFVDDGGKLTDPLNLNNIRNIESVKTYHRFRTSRVQYYLDETQPNYYQTEIYMVNPPRGTGYQVHESRCIPFDGEDCPPEVRLMNYDWGDSVLQAVYTRLRGLGESYAGCEHIISEFILTFLQMNGLANMIAGGQERAIKERLNILDLSKHISNTVLLDKDETINRISASISGLPDLMGKLIQATSAETGIPVRKLFGEVNVGSSLGDNREEETDDYNNMISSEQQEKLLPALEILARIIMLNKTGPTSGQEIPNWEIKFDPLRQMSQKEICDARKIQMETDSGYVTSGILAPEEIRDSRFGGDSYSFETKIDPKLDLKKELDDKTNPDDNEGE